MNTFLKMGALTSQSITHTHINHCKIMTKNNNIMVVEIAAAQSGGETNILSDHPDVTESAKKQGIYTRTSPRCIDTVNYYQPWVRLLLSPCFKLRGWLLP